MNRNLTLSIPAPCSQQWNSFNQVDGGGFCNSCSKVVVDFTTMTDAEIINYFKHTSGATCGRFLPDQLGTYSLHNPVKVGPGFMLLKAGLLSLLMLLVSRYASAQENFKGRVTSAEDHTALPGVNVVIKGTTTGTVTDPDGRFEFSEPLEKGDVIVFSFIGLTTKEYQVDGKNDVGFEVPMQLCMSYDIMGGVQVEGIYTEKKPGFWARVKEFFGA